MTIGIVYATEAEAAPFIARTAAMPMTSRPLPLFKLPARVHPACVLAISGMGKVAASLAATHLVAKHQAQVLINAGVCGRLREESGWAVGALLRIDQAVEGDCDRCGQPETGVPCAGGWFPALPAAHLVTCDKPVFGAEQRRALAALGHLADMEGAAVARVAHCYGIDCALLKGISDGADEGGRQALAANLGAVAEAIAAALLDELQQQAINPRP